MTNPQHLINIGNGKIVATNTEFLSGFDAGNEAYHTSQEYTGEFIMDMALAALEDMDHSTAWSIGFIIGWFSAFAVMGGMS